MKFRREVLLVEVERWCGDHLCRAMTRLALTKGEARAFEGFECERCGRRNSCSLTARDIPDWWDELRGAADGTTGEGAIGRNDQES